MMDTIIDGTEVTDVSGLPAMSLYADSQRGVYIPKEFAETYNRSLWQGIDKDDIDVLCAGPEHEQYWDAWDNVLNNAKVVGDDGYTYILYQDGDLWVICYERITEEDRRNFGFDEY